MLNSFDRRQTCVILKTCITNRRQFIGQLARTVNEGLDVLTTGGLRIRRRDFRFDLLLGLGYRFVGCRFAHDVLPRFEQWLP